MREQPGIITAALYEAFLHCPRRAWYEARRRQNRMPSREMQRESFFDLAAETVLPRTDFDFRTQSFSDRIEHTAIIVGAASRTAAGTAVLGSAFISDTFLAEPDLLVLPPEGGVEITELKTSAGLRSSHIFELAWQTEILSRLGIFPRKISLVHINRDFILSPASGPSESGFPAPGSFDFSPMDYGELFISQDVTKRVCAAAAGLGKKMETLAGLLGDSEPPAPGPSCSGPDRCPCGDLCRPDYPKHHVFTLHQGSRTSRDLSELGIIELKDVPENFKVSRKQRIQIDAVRSGKPFIDPAGIAAFVGSLEYPLSFLDFETFSTAIPLYERISPWEHVPFAFSLHVQNGPDLDPAGFFFIADETSDPRPPFLETLVQRLPREGSIIVYNRRFEAGIVRGLGVSYPLWKPWAEGICLRMADLLVPFQDFRYYHPDQMGRVSMKKVLPALTGRNYSDLTIENGEEANSLYAEIALASRQAYGPSPDREKVRKAIQEYCSLDTEGMVLILRELGRAEKGGG